MSLPSRKLLLPIVVLLVASGLMLGVATTIPAAHAVPGDAGDPSCIATNGINPCLSIDPSSASLPAPGGTFSLKVNYTELPTFSAWDIAIKTSIGVLKPTSITLVETFSGTSATFSNCVNGTGAGCTSIDGAGIAHSAVSSLSGSDAGNGTLFIVNYQVVAGPSTTVTYVSSPGVEDSSVSDPSGFTLVDCNATPGACLTGSVSVTDFTVTASPTTVNTSGPGVTGTTTITVSPLSGFTGTVNLAAGPKPANAAVTASLASPSVTITSGPMTDLLTLSSSASGTFTIVVNGTATGFPLRSTSVSLVVAITKNNSSTSTTIVNEGTGTSAGASFHDTATVTGVAGTTPTGSYTYKFFNNNACTGTALTSQTVTLSGGLVPNSASTGPLAAGSYSFQGSYAGDANYNPSTSNCEPQTVSKATPTITTNILSPSGGPVTTIIVGTSVTDQATLSGGFPASGVSGTVSYFFFSNGACSGTGTPEGTVTVGAGNSVGPSNSVTPVPAGSYSFNATYSGDGNNNAVTSACEVLTVQPASPTISSTVTPSSTTIGGSASDLATVAGGFSPTGTVTYTAYSDSACTVVAFGPNTQPLGSASSSFTPTATGTFFWIARYSGDANNNAAATLCGAAGETLTVAKASPTISSTVSPASITIGGSATDLATLSGGFSPTGTVIYTAYSDSACTVVAFGPNTQPVGSASNSFTPTTAGTYNWIASYSGDGNNNAAATLCGATGETLTVAKASPTISSVVSPASIPIGGSASDLASLAGGFSPTGTVTYTAYSDAACTALVFTSANIPLGTASGSFTPGTAGTYFWIASYSGDGNNNAAATLCGAAGETLTVAKATPSINTSILNSAGAPVTSIVVGSTVTDQATLTGGFPATGVSGTVSYTFYANNNCAPPGTPEGTKTVGASNSVGPSNPVTVTTVGSFSFNAAYSGDSNNNAVTSPCEQLSVTKATPTISSAVSPASITLGASASDLATVSGGFGPTGTVTYTAFSDAACTVVAFGPNVKPVGSASDAFTPTAAGTYLWIASYSGDANNNAAATLCGASGETLTVVAGLVITSTVTPSTIVIGGSASDLATVSGGSSPTGTVTYKAYSDSACTAQVFTDTEPLGTASAAFTPTVAGTYQWIATYNGDANNAPASTVCGATGETLTVQKASPSIATTIRDVTGAPVTSITVGNAVTDTATLTGGFPVTGVSGTVAYTFYSNMACSGTGTPEGTVPVGPGNSVGASNTVTPAPAGSYSFNAMYSGDANNNAATSPCEGLTVNPVTTDTLSSTVSPSTMTIGGSASDLATLSGGFNPTGTVTYNAFSDPACSVLAFGPNTQPLGSASSAFTPAAIGTYFWTASYSGDANNNAASTACGAAGETLTVQIASPTITSKITPSTITLGQSATDLATLSGGFSPTGTVTYTAFSDAACTVVAFGPNVKPVGSSSDPFTPVATGTYFWIASYSGDANNNPVATVCGDTTETLNVVTLPTPTLTTTVRDSTGAAVTSVVVGTTIHDTATITPTPPATSVTGTVTYNLYQNGPGAPCQGTLLMTDPVTITSTGTVPDSTPFMVTAPGSYSFLVTYSGDANNAPTNVCETFTVTPATPTITTLIIVDSTGQPAPSAGVTVGTMVHDTASIANAFNPTGMVTYSFFNNGACDPAGLVTSQSVPVNPDGTVPPMSSITLNTTGTFSFMASYSGDANNSPASSSCEVLVVSPASPSVATVIIDDSTGLPVTAAGVQVGTSVHDTATLTGGFSPGGTVTYSFFTNGGCTAGIGPVQTFVVPVAGGVVPPSPSVTPMPAGTYSFQAQYSGDANNNPSTSSCEVLNVFKITSTIFTAVTPSTMPIGNSATDSANVTIVNGITPTGSVVFTVYSDTACSTQVFTDTEPLGTPSAPFTPTTAGSYQWIARYSGDSNYSPANSTCGAEPLQVTDFTVTASPTAVSVKVGVTGTSTIAVTGIAGFSGNVSLSLSTSAGLTCTLSPSSLVLPPDGTSTLSCSALASGTYTAIVNGTSPGYPSEASHVAHVTFMVTAQDFTITASPNFIIAKTHPSKVTSAIVVVSVGGFSGPVTLTATSSPSAGIMLSFSSTTLTVPAGGTASATLTIRITHTAIVNPGTYIITITGTDGTSGPHSTTITLIIPSSTSASVAFPSLTWIHTLSVSSSGGVQSWTAMVQNTLATAQYVQVTVTGISTIGTHSFTTQSAVVLVAAGATQTITFSTPAGTFTSADIGLTFNFAAKVLFGSTPALGSVSKDIQTGSFTVTA